MTEHTGLNALDGKAPVLTAIHAQGRIEGLLLHMQLTQHYRNTGSTAIETVYTFPLAWGATLLGLSVQLGAHLLEGQVIARPEASERYEQAVVDGDTPVLVEDAGNGLFTAQVGNLLPGEEAVLTLRYAQPLRIEQDRVRIVLPTTVAPRFGDAHLAGGLPAHAPVTTSLTASYPFTVQVDVLGTLAGARLLSPSHAVAVQALPDGQRAVLGSEAWLDRDFILLLEELPASAFAVAARGADGTFGVLASFCPPRRQPPVAHPLRLKLLVDCSGSMGGDSIHQARDALLQIVGQLQAVDLVSYSRFGSRLIHDVPLQLAGAASDRQALIRAIGATEADLGGTEIHQAITGTLALQFAADTRGVAGAQHPEACREAQTADVLLITDGSVWDIEQVVQQVRNTRHRIFAIGVGSAPGESLLRQLAEESGGACELVTPNEDMAAAVLRMFHRLRGGGASQVLVTWPCAPVWESAWPKAVYDGETVHLYARFASLPDGGPLLSWASSGGDAEAPATLVGLAASLQATHEDTVSRLVGGQELRACTDAAEQTALAIRHQLVSSQTSLLLVHGRAEADKPVQFPELSVVAHMHAAGAQGIGSVMGRSASRNQHFNASYARDGEISFLRSDPARRSDHLAMLSMDLAVDAQHMATDVPASLLRDLPTAQDPALAPLHDVLQQVSDLAARCTSPAEFHAQALQLPWPRSVGRLLRWLQPHTGTPLHALLLFLQVLQHVLEPGVAPSASSCCSADLAALLAQGPAMDAAQREPLEERCREVITDLIAGAARQTG